MKSFRLLCILSVLTTCSELTWSQTAKSKGTYSIQTRTRKVTGSPLVWDNQKLFLLTGYGTFEEVKFNNVKEFEKKSPLRVIFSKNSFERKLKSEFGSRYQVSRTRDYLVVHPVSQGQYWPQKIQSVYTAFGDYFKGRRISIGQRDYPLVAVVFATQSEFRQYARKMNDKISRSVVGYYSPNTNRVAMYDQSLTGGASQQNMDTIVHEIAHQAAFNCGIHSRFGDTPRWVVEGLGTMFEAKGVWNSLRHPRQTDRVNAGLLNLYNKQIVAKKKKGWVGAIVTGNRIFEKAPETAYSCAWALSFYLMETQPYDYVKYMKKLNYLPAFEKYSQEKRLTDFERAFGSTKRLEGSLQNFYAKFKLQ